jgi:hypothetical protein
MSVGPGAPVIGGDIPVGPFALIGDDSIGRGIEGAGGGEGGGDV